MPDTGSDLGETTARYTERALERLLEHRFMMRRMGVTPQGWRPTLRVRPREKGEADIEPSRAEAEASVLRSDLSADIEHVQLTFHNHPDDPLLDVTHATSYVEAMEGLGFDVHMGEPDPDAGSVVSASYPITWRSEFVLASGVSLHDAGAL